MISHYTLTDAQLDTILDRIEKNRNTAGVQHVVVEKEKEKVKEKVKESDPGGLGLAGFALTTFVLSVYNTNAFVEHSLEGMVLPLALFYGGLAQFCAGMWEMYYGNTFGATAFTSYGAFWMSFAAYVHIIAPDLDEDIINHATGLFLFAWTIFSFYMWIASFRTNVMICAIFTVLMPTLVLLVIGNWAKSEECTHAGGWFGIVCAFLAWYGSAATVINSTFGEVVLPVGPIPKTSVTAWLRGQSAGKHVDDHTNPRSAATHTVDALAHSNSNKI